MSERFLDVEGWRRAWGPAIRTFGYMTALYVLLFIVLIVPTYAIVSAGGPSAPYEIAGFVYIIAMVFIFFLSFFKVLDEERPGDIKLL